MQFEFTAKVEKLGYATVREVTDQAKTHLDEPDWIILALSIGVWEQTRNGWQASVTATVDDGSPIGGDPASGLPAVWSA